MEYRIGEHVANGSLGAVCAPALLAPDAGEWVKEALSKYPLVPIGTFIVLVLLVVGVYTVAFFQGRPVSFWPPKVGPKPNQKRASHPLSSGDHEPTRIPPGLEALLQSTNLPMFFADLDRVVVRCNAPLTQLLDSSTEKLENKHALVLVERLAELVPEHRRDEYLERQRGLQDKYEERLHPNSDDFEYIDTSDHPVSNLWRGKFKLWIHADRIRMEGKELGYFVIYHLEEVKRIP